VGVTAGLAESNGSLPPGLRLTSTTKNRDQLRNPTIGNRVWATITLHGVLVFVSLSAAAGVERRELSVCSGRTMIGLDLDSPTDPFMLNVAPVDHCENTTGFATANFFHVSGRISVRPSKYRLPIVIDRLPGFLLFQSENLICTGCSDVTESMAWSMVTTRSPFCGYNTT